MNQTDKVNNFKFFLTVSYYDKSLDDFEEVVSISPPDGYKDMDLEENQLIALQKILNKKRQQQQYQIDQSPFSNLCRDCIEQRENGNFYNSDKYHKIR